MRKTIITLVGIIVALFSMVACQDYSAEEKLVEATFVPTSTKAINQSSETHFGADTDVNSYYWTYYCDTVEPSADSEFTRFCNTLPAKKGLGVIKNLIKGEYYFFGIKGYSDENYTNLVWEGYTGLEGNDGDKYESVQLNARNTLVTIHVFSAGHGTLSFDISASINDQFKNSPAFKLEFQRIGETDVITTYVNESTEGFAIKDDEIVYKASMPYDIGTYFVTISQQYKEGIDYEQVPQRKQVIIVNIAGASVTLLSGSLDSTIDEKFYYIAKGWVENENHNMWVRFHRSFDEDVDYMESNVDGIKFAVQDNGTVYTGFGDESFFEPTPTKDETVNVDWYIDGIPVDADECVLDCYDYVPGQVYPTESSYLVRKGNLLKFYRGTGDENIYLLSCINQGEEQTAESVVISLHCGGSYIITYQVSEWNKEHNDNVEVETKYFLYNTVESFDIQTPMKNGVYCTEGVWQTTYGLNYQYAYNFGDTHKFGDLGIYGDLSLYYFIGGEKKGDYYGF